MLVRQLTDACGSYLYSSDEFVYKVPNPYAEDRYLYFISDQPRLLKTIRNSWSSKVKKLWVCFHCNCLIIFCSVMGMKYLGHIIEDLYLTETSTGSGLMRVPKLKYKHIHSTSFSKMRVGLRSCPSEYYQLS